MFDFLDSKGELVKDFDTKLKNLMSKFLYSIKDNEVINSKDTGVTIGSNGSNSVIYSFGKSSVINSSGDVTTINCGGNNSTIASIGKYSTINCSCYSSTIASTGDYATINCSGEPSTIVSKGDYATIRSDHAFSTQIFSDGERAIMELGGCNLKINSTGNLATINLHESTVEEINSTGDFATINRINSTGDHATIITHSASIINITGFNAIVFISNEKTIIKARKGTTIVSPYLSTQERNDDYKDSKGRSLSENEYYCLFDGKFYPVDISDNIITIKMSEKKKDGITIIKGKRCEDWPFNAENYEDLLFDDENVFIVKENNISAHGYTLREAVDDFNFKKLKREGREKIVKEIKDSGKVTKPQYRALTGACEFGVNEFCKKNNITVEEISLDELRKVLINDYGAKQFWSLIDGNGLNDEYYTNFIDYNYDDDLPF